MKIRVEVPDSAGGADETRSLLAWLRDADELRGRVTADESPPLPGTLGPVLDGLTVALGSGGAVTGLVTALVAWIRSRRSDVVVKVTRPDGSSLELSATRVRTLTEEGLRQLAADTSRTLEASRDTDALRP